MPLLGQLLTGNLLGWRPGIGGAPLGPHVAPLGVTVVHRLLASRAFRCSAYRLSASGTASRYQPSQLPDLSPATRKIASRTGSNAKRIRISVAPVDAGRNSFML